jgi:hypothetical protein
VCQKLVRDIGEWEVDVWLVRRRAAPVFVTVLVEGRRWSLGVVVGPEVGHGRRNRGYPGDHGFCSL